MNGLCRKLYVNEEMMVERGIRVDHSAIHRWAVRFSPLSHASKGGTELAYKRLTQQASGVVRTCVYPLRCECRQLSELPRRRSVDYARHQHDAQIIGQLSYRPFQDVSDRAVGHLAFLEQLLASTLAARTI